VAYIAVHRDDRTADGTLRGPQEGELGHVDARVLASFLLAAWAVAAERDGQPAVALARLLAVLDHEGTREFPGVTMSNCVWLPDVVRLALEGGEEAIAAAAAKACTRENELRPRAASAAALQHCQGLLDHDPAPAESAADVLLSLGLPLLRAQALENAAVLHAARDATAAARAAYLQAVSIYSDLGAAWDIRRADTRLRRYGIRRGTRSARHRPATGWAALTPTEQRIAQLIAEGLSNPDIASRLYLSRSTVQTHVSHILTKLGARSRVQAARAVPGRLPAGSLNERPHTVLQAFYAPVIHIRQLPFAPSRVPAGLRAPAAAEACRPGFT
jgi:DNA-binding CsgD family transcriptional regulator